MHTHTPELGDTFDHRYKIERELGRGGFATVFLATNTMTGAKVALKVLTPGSGGYDREMKRRFLREGEILAQVEHANVVRLYHSGDADGLLYMASEYVPGEDLADVLGRRTFSSAETTHILMQLLDALCTAHRAGLVHRDIKPENVRVCPTLEDPLQVKLLDFGIARATHRGAPALTKTGELIGTPRYMAPEQLREQGATPASDIYALGVIGFELLLGRDALHGGAWGDQLERLQTQHLLAVDRLEEIPSQLRSVLQRMTTSRPDARYQSASAVMNALTGAPQEGLAPAERAPTTLLVLMVTLVVLIGLGSVVVLSMQGADSEPGYRPAQPTNASAGTLIAGEPAPRPTPGVEDAAVESDFGPHASAGCSKAKASSLFDGPSVLTPRACRGRPCPLVIAFHGNYMRDGVMEDLLASSAKKHNFLLSTPRGGSFIAWPEGPDAHVMLSKRSYAEALESACVDRSRVYLIGYSDGANPVVQASCERWVTAAAAFGKSWRTGSGSMCQDRTRPFLWLHPKDSTQVPQQTKESCIGQEKLGYEAITEIFRRLHRCSGDAEPTVLGDRTTCRAWTCESPLSSCLVDGGRLWPGHRQSIDAVLHRKCDPQKSKADVGQVMWTFFADTPPLENPPTLDELRSE